MVATLNGNALPKEVRCVFPLLMNVWPPHDENKRDKYIINPTIDPPQVHLSPI